MATTFEETSAFEVPHRAATPEELAGATWLTRMEAASYARISVKTIDRWSRDGILTRYKVANLQSVRYRREELDGMIESEAGNGGQALRYHLRANFSEGERREMATMLSRIAGRTTGPFSQLRDALID